MTALALQKEQSALIDSLSMLIEKCESVDFANILRTALSHIQAKSTTAVSYSTRTSDEELAAFLACEPEFDINSYVEPTEEQWHTIAASNRGKLTKGLEKWL